MKVLNIHTRKIGKPVHDLLELFSTLATKHDQIWPKESWPAMKFKNGLQVGANGGHGPIRYQIIDFDPASHIEFKFQKPSGFHGSHKLEISALDADTTEIKHTIDITTSGSGTLSWLLGIRSLHDALIEDAFDKVERQLTHTDSKTTWSLWVKLLRWFFKPKKR